MHKSDIEKENRILESKNKDLRNKNLDLQNENQRLFNEKIVIQKDINELLESKKILSVEVSELKDKIAKSDETIKAANLDIAKERAGLDQIQAQQRDAWIDISNAKEKNQKEDERIKRSWDEIKKKTSEQARRDVEIGDKLILADIKIKEAGEVKDNANTILNDAKKKTEQLVLKEEKLEGDTKKTNDLKMQYEAGIAENSSLRKTLNQSISENRQALVKFEEDRAELARQTAITKNKQIELDNEKAKINSMHEDFKTKENEFEVKRLRVEKLIRDKDIKEELEKLRKEVA